MKNKPTYDFYYSETGEQIRLENTNPYFPKCPIITINGLRYTEAIKEGRKPLSKFEDLKKVFTGTLDTFKAIL